MTLYSKKNEETNVVGEYVSFIDLENRLAELFNEGFFRVLEKDKKCLVGSVLYFI